MRILRSIVVGILLCVPLAACDGSGAVSSPVAPSSVSTAAPAPTVAPCATSFCYGAGWALSSVTLSGVAFELTPQGRTPVEGVEIYCDACGEEGHTAVTTGEDGAYRFTGVWLKLGVPTSLIVTKEGFVKEWPQVAVSGDTHFDVQLRRH